MVKEKIMNIQQILSGVIKKETINNFWNDTTCCAIAARWLLRGLPSASIG